MRACLTVGAREIARDVAEAEDGIFQGMPVAEHRDFSKKWLVRQRIEFLQKGHRLGSKIWNEYPPWQSVSDEPVLLVVLQIQPCLDRWAMGDGCSRSTPFCLACGAELSFTFAETLP